MADNFDQTLDRCLDRIRSGEDIESILADYPGDTIRLRPLLRTTVETVQAYSYSPAAGAKRDARERFTAALTELRETRRQKQPWFKRAFVRPATWAAVATLVVAIVVAFVGVRPALSPLFSPGSQVLPIAPVTSAGGNFAFLISDEVNAVADFESVIVGIDRIGLQRQDDGKWIEFKPEIAEVDLTQVPGDAVQEVWRGEIPSGEFRQVFVYVDNVTGVLKATGRTTEIKLPASNLHLSLPFAVTDDSVTSFTYDMTVFGTGNERNQKYMLKPQIGESGARQDPRQQKEYPADKGTGNGNNGKSDDRNTSPGRPASLPTPTRKNNKE